MIAKWFKSAARMQMKRQSACVKSLSWQYQRSDDGHANIESFRRCQLFKTVSRNLSLEKRCFSHCIITLALQR